MEEPFDVTFIVDPLIIINEIVIGKTRSDKCLELQKQIQNKFAKTCEFINNMKKFIITKYFLHMKKQINSFLQKYTYDIVTIDVIHLNNEAWKKYRYCYNFIRECKIQNKNPIDITKQINCLIKFTIENEIFVNIIKKTDEYKNIIEKRWNDKEKIVISFVETLTKIKIQGRFFIALLCPPEFYAGYNLEFMTNQKLIKYGHTERWNNYSIVYIMHEILHSVFKFGNDITHCIIELISDNSLRMYLNASTEDYTMGHKYLTDLRLKMVPYWKKYIKSNDNIYKFVEDMVKMTKIT